MEKKLKLFQIIWKCLEELKGGKGIELHFFNTIIDSNDFLGFFDSEQSFWLDGILWNLMKRLNAESESETGWRLRKEHWIIFDNLVRISKVSF